MFALLLFRNLYLSLRLAKISWKFNKKKTILWFHTNFVLIIPGERG